jgi:copper chaperone NosL
MMHMRQETLPPLILLLTALAFVSALATLSMAAELMELPNGSKLDLTQKCPVCEMVIGGKDARSVTWTYEDGRVVGFGGVAAAVFADGHVVGFEGARCLFIYNSVPQKYDVDVRNIKYQFVTDFVSKKMIALPKAFLVLGSNVKGPMGYDLIPFTAKEEAAKFAAENDGKWIVQLHEVGRTVENKQSEVKPDKVEPTSSVEKRIPEQRTPYREYPRSMGHGQHMH